MSTRLTRAEITEHLKYVLRKSGANESLVDFVMQAVNAIAWCAVDEDTRQLRDQLTETSRLMMNGEMMRQRLMLDAIVGEFPPKIPGVDPGEGGGQND